MLSENIAVLRKAKGLSQQELATRLNVVRQTVSKWEKGLSVPDSEMLICLAKELETPVNELLGETLPQPEPGVRELAEKLERLNEQFAAKNEARRRAWRVAWVVLGALALAALALAFAPLVHQQVVLAQLKEGAAIIGGADGPTAIWVASARPSEWQFILAGAALAAAVAGFAKTRRRR